VTALLLGRRATRPEGGLDVAFSDDEAAATGPRPPAPSPSTPSPAPLVSPGLPSALDEALAESSAAPIGLRLEPLRLSVSLVNATLQYRLTVINNAETAFGTVAIAADMIGAHASIPTEVQLAQDGTTLEPRHRLQVLLPGESAELRGELRLPLAAVTPIRSGIATLLVPLVRVRAEAEAITLTQTFVVGETPDVAGAPLRPFRLDTGPRIFGAVSQRAIADAA
jgi:hypothetical protein